VIFQSPFAGTNAYQTSIVTLTVSEASGAG
jgi:hypothetical protein